MIPRWSISVLQGAFVALIFCFFNQEVGELSIDLISIGKSIISRKPTPIVQLNDFVIVFKK